MITNEEKYEFIRNLCSKAKTAMDSEQLIKEDINLLMKANGGGKLYKYRKVDDDGYAIANLVEGTLYCAKASSFNDPFDCRIGIDLSSYVASQFNLIIDNLLMYFDKFQKLRIGQLAIADCSEHERVIFEKWNRNTNICEIFEEICKMQLAETDLLDFLAKNIKTICEMIFVLFEAEYAPGWLEIQREEFFDVFFDIPFEQAIFLISKGIFTHTDLIKGMGLDADVDEITGVKLIAKEKFPNLKEDAISLENQLNEMAKAIRNRIDEQYRVGCLCTDYNNRLMWAHYADNHEGFCIEYDFSNLCSELNELLFLPVIYSKERIKFPWDIAQKEVLTEEEQDYAQIVELLSLLTKDEVWSYEDEWRIIQLNAEGDINVKMPPITCIYIGESCSVENRNQIIDIAKNMNVPVKQMTLDRGEYLLHAVDI